MSATNDRIMRLKEEIAKENLSFQELERRLSAAIDAEYEKKCSDIQFINACEDLLWELKTEGKLKFQSKNEQYKTAMQKYMRPIKQSNSPAFAARFVTVFAALVLVFVLAEGVFHWEWLRGTTTDDNQQFVITGHSIDVEMISRSIAEHQDNDYLITENQQDAWEFLGFTPKVPNLEKWDMTISQYNIFISPTDIMLSILYEDNKNAANSTVYVAHYVTCIEDFHQAFEQSSSEQIAQLNGIDVYVAENTNSYSYTWIDGNIVHRIDSNISPHDVSDIIDSTIGGSQ